MSKETKKINIPMSKQTWHVVPLIVGKATLVRGGKMAAVRKAERMARDKKRDFVVVQAKVLVDYK